MPPKESRYPKDWLALAEGLTPEEIIDHYLPLKVEDIRAAVGYAAELARENVWKVSA